MRQKTVLTTPDIERPLGPTTHRKQAQRIMTTPQFFDLGQDKGFVRFDGIGPVTGGGATSVLLKNYPCVQRGQILDLVYKPKFGASVNALMVEVPGDGNSTQGTMPSHMHSRDDLNFERGYIWWFLSEAKKRNPRLSIDAVAWSAPGWVGNGDFWSSDTADYYVKWLEGLQNRYGLHVDALGCRNEKGVSFEFARLLRSALDQAGFSTVALHGFDNWKLDKFDFVPLLMADPETRDAIAIISAHVMYGETGHAPADIQRMAREMGKPIWNTEDHVYKDGFDCLISIVECFNDNYVLGGASRVTLWYDIAGVYPLEPYSRQPPMILAHSPWSGHYSVKQALWGYAHYGQFTEVGWHYHNAGCGVLDGGGSVVTLVSPEGDISLILETKGAAARQTVRFRLGPQWQGKSFCVWQSNAAQQFLQAASPGVQGGILALDLDPDTVYSLSTTTGQQKGAFADAPAYQPFPLPYGEDFSTYGALQDHGYLPRYFADIGGVFELSPRPDGFCTCLRQVVDRPTISWAPEWLPYSIIGDQDWRDVEVCARIYLAKGEAAGIMGRIAHVGTGYGYVPECYYFSLASDGQCKLCVVRGKENKTELVGDAEQQALIQSQSDRRAGGEHVLASTRLDTIGPDRWHRISLAFEGSRIMCRIDGAMVFDLTDDSYAKGMAGIIALMAEGGFSRPYYADFQVSAPNAEPTTTNPLTPRADTISQPRP